MIKCKHFRSILLNLEIHGIFKILNLIHFNYLLQYELKTKIDQLNVRTDTGIKDLEENEKIENSRLQSLVR